MAVAMEKQSNEKGCKLLSLNWDRIYLKLTVGLDADDSASRLAVRKQGDDKVIPLISEREGNVFSFLITMAVQRSFLASGAYQLGLTGPAVSFRPLLIDDSQISQLANWAHVYYYGHHDAFCYNITFDAVIDNDRIGLLMKTRFMQDNPTPEKEKVNVGEKSFSRRWVNRLEVFIKGLIRLTYQIGCLFAPKNGHRVLFLVQTHKGLGGNLTALHDRLKERHLDFQITVCCYDLLAKGLNLKGWFASTVALCNKDYVFVDDYEPIFSFVKLDDKTKLIQVWHAGLGSKTTGYTRYGYQDAPHPYNMSHRQTDYAIVGAAGLVNDYVAYFGIEMQAFLPTGLPRMDGYSDEQTKAAFRRQFFAQHPEFIGKKIVLFAPTFRGKGGREAYYDYSKIDFSLLKKYLGAGYIVLFKFHFLIRDKIMIPADCQSFCFDFTWFPDINKLLYVTDVLVTDYSSVIYEYALMNKPMVFYAFDQTVYNLQRGVFENITAYNLGPVCTEFEDVVKTIAADQFDLKPLAGFVSRYHTAQPQHACDAIIDTVLLHQPLKGLGNDQQN